MTAAVSQGFRLLRQPIYKLKFPSARLGTLLLRDIICPQGTCAMRRHRLRLHPMMLSYPTRVRGVFSFRARIASAIRRSTNGWIDVPTSSQWLSLFHPLNVRQR